MNDQVLPALRSFSDITKPSLLADPAFKQTLTVAAAKLNISYPAALCRFSNSFDPDPELEAAIKEVERERYPLLTLEVKPNEPHHPQV